MREFKLYSSGILYGTVWFGEGSVAALSELDVFTGAFGEKTELSPEREAYLTGFTKLNLEQAAQLLSKEQCFADAAAALEKRGSKNEALEFETAFGSLRYLTEDGKNFMQRDVKFPNNVLLKEGRIIAFICPAREMVTVLVEAGMEDETVLSAWKKDFAGEEIHPIAKPVEYMIPMRDGVKLAADVYLPADKKENLPTVLVRTPYSKEVGADVYFRYVQRGYAVVVEDVRGRNRSEGEWYPCYSEVEDGDDTLNWIAAQSWSSGRVGMVGGSYLGYVQWCAAASSNPHLKALISVVTSGSPFVDIPRRGGTMTSGMMAWAFMVSKKQADPALLERDDWDEVLNIRPLTDIPMKALGYEVPFLRKWTEERDNDDFWQMGSWKDRHQGAVIPALIQSGWYDDNGMGTTEALEIVKDFPPEYRKVILGPWQHSGNSRYDMHAVSFGNKALRFDLDLIYFKWFARHLKEVENDIDELSPVQYYTVGEDQWKEAAAWPVPETKELSLYFDSDGGANTSLGNGRLLSAPKETEGADSFFYDPKDPATHIIDMSENELEVPEDYTEEEKRADMLCYTTEPLKEALTVTGDAIFELYVSSDAPDTDFIVRITDVDEKGRSVKHADGILSARYRNGFERSEFMEPGQVYALKIRTTKMSLRFAAGHRLRVTITSGAKNFAFPNSNTVHGYCSTETVIANNTVHHGGNYPSRVVLRVE